MRVYEGWRTGFGIQLDPSCMLGIISDLGIMMVADDLK
jgi:hypothetical protein